MLVTLGGALGGGIVGAGGIVGRVDLIESARCVVAWVWTDVLFVASLKKMRLVQWPLGAFQLHPRLAMWYVVVLLILYSDDSHKSGHAASVK